MGTPGFVASLLKVWAPWGPPNLQLVCEVRAACWEQCPELVDSHELWVVIVKILLQYCTTPSSLLSQGTSG